jgi:hypothetical protein
LKGYLVLLDLPPSLSEEEIGARLEAFRVAPTLTVERHQGKRRKVLDLKALVPRMEGAGPHRIRAVLRCHPLGSARPAEVLQAVFGLGPSAAREVRIVREAALFEETEAGLDAECPPGPPAALAQEEDHAVTER